MSSLSRRLQIDYYVGGALQAVLKPIVVLLGKTLKRDHSLAGADTVTFLKLLGGGSLVIAYPSLVALKQSGKIKKLRLIASPKTKPFADTLGLFDEIVVIRDDKLTSLIWDSVKTLIQHFRTGTLVDLEVHSRLTTVFCLMTCARNRIGFYTLNSFWRQGLSTHLLFCNQATGVVWIYDQIVKLFDAQPLSLRAASGVFIEQLETRMPQPMIGPRDESTVRIGIAPCCSDLSRERMLEIAEWVGLITTKAEASPKRLEIHLLGAPGDRSYLDGLAAALLQARPEMTVVNQAGKLKLHESVRLLGSLSELYAIDSALLHFARLYGIRTNSFWGPTDPSTLLRTIQPEAESVHYRKISCSPCVHISTVVPCKGNNVCMRLAVNPQAPIDPNPCWIA